MEDNIYKAMPVLNTLGINVNQHAPDNNALQFGKALLGIATDVYAQKKESEFNSKVAQINQLELDFKNKVLVNKDIDLQDPVKREEIFKTANDLTEAQKKIILDYKHLDYDDIQKLEGILIKSTGERAFNLQNDTNKIMIKQETDHKIDETVGAIDHIKQAEIKSVVDTSYQMVHNNVGALKKLGMQEQAIASTIYKPIIGAEGYRLDKELEEKLQGKNIVYSEVIDIFEGMKKELINDQYLDDKVDTMLFYFKGTNEEKERARGFFKDNLKVEYEKTFASKREWVMQQYETQKERELNQQRFEKQYALDSEKLSYEKQRDEEYKVQRAIDSGNALSAISLANGYNTTLPDLFTTNNFSRLTGGIAIDKAIANGQTINVFSNERLGALKNAKQIAYQTGKGIPEFFNSNLKSEIDSLPSLQAKEMYIRNLDAQGLIPYKISKMYLDRDPDFNRAMQSLSDIETKTGGVKNRIDITGMGNNMFKESFTKYGLDNQQQQYLTDYITMLGNTNQLPKGVIIGNGGDFTRNVRDSYISNSEFRNMVDSEARLIKKYGSKSSFKVIPISQDLVNEAGSKAYNNATPAKAYIDVKGKSRSNVGQVKVMGNNKSTGSNKVQKTTTKNGSKIKYFNSVK